MKGYYKRAKAHAAVWNEKEARRDFNMVAHLDVTLSSLVNRELKALSDRIREKYWEEKERYWNVLETKDEEEVEDEVKTEDTEGPTTAQDDVKEDESNKESRSKDGDGENKEGTEEKDWQQMLRLVMLLQDEGNFLVKENRCEEASVKFQEAIDYIHVLQNKVGETAYIGKSGRALL